MDNMRSDTTNMIADCGYANSGDNVVWNWNVTGSIGSIVIHLNIADPLTGENIVS